jgi:hypothetical protein
MEHSESIAMSSGYPQRSLAHQAMIPSIKRTQSIRVSLQQIYKYNV